MKEHPSKLIIDPMPHCNLSCPLCEGEKRRDSNRDIMPLDTFKSIVDQAEQFDQIHLYNWGESFLHKDIAEMISYCKSNEFYTGIHSNLNVPQERVENGVKAGLDFISASIDGVSEEAYEAYRVNGRLNLAMENLELLADLQHSHDIQVVWQYLVNRFNEHELDDARQLSKNLGVEFNPLPIGVGDDIPDANIDNIDDLIEHWTARDNLYAVRREYGGKFPKRKRQVSSKCSYLKNQVIIRPNLNVGPCCMTADRSSDFGSLKENALEQILKNEKFEQAHRLFDTSLSESKRSEIEESDESPVCTDCIIYKKFSKRHESVKSEAKSLDNLIRDDKLEKLATGEVSRQGVRAAHEARELFTERDYDQESSLRSVLTRTDEELFRKNAFSMTHMPAYSVLALGSAATADNGESSDLEFMMYALEETTDAVQEYMPAILGALRAKGVPVDDWTAVNILSETAIFTPQTSYNEQKNADILDAYVEQRNISEILKEEPIFCDIFSLPVAGRAEVAHTVRDSKYQLLKSHRRTAQKTAYQLIEHNIENQTPYRKKSLAYGYIMQEIDKGQARNILHSALDNPGKTLHDLMADIRIDHGSLEAGAANITSRLRASIQS